MLAVVTTYRMAAKGHSRSPEYYFCCNENASMHLDSQPGSQSLARVQSEDTVYLCAEMHSLLGPVREDVQVEF